MIKVIDRIINNLLIWKCHRMDHSKNNSNSPVVKTVNKNNRNSPVIKTVNKNNSNKLKWETKWK